jgi:hypothetical protein
MEDQVLAHNSLLQQRILQLEKTVEILAAPRTNKRRKINPNDEVENEELVNAEYHERLTDRCINQARDALENAKKARKNLADKEKITIRLRHLNSN